MGNKINRLRSKPAVVGWISFAVLIWKILGEIDTLNSAVENMSTVWNFLSTPLGMLALLVIGLGLIFYSVLRPEHKKVVKETDQVDAKFRDALQHVIIEGRDNIGLQVHEGRAGHPVIYPIKLRNTRPQVVDIVGFNVTILWDGEPIDNVTWRSPSRDARNGLAIHPPFDSPEPLDALRIQPDNPYRLGIPVNMSKVSAFPPQLPAWTARGTIYFKCGSENGEQQFNFDTDNYKLSDKQWGWYRNNRMLKD